MRKHWGGPVIQRHGTAAEETRRYCFGIASTPEAAGAAGAALEPGTASGEAVPGIWAAPEAGVETLGASSTLPVAAAGASRVLPR